MAGPWSVTRNRPERKPGQDLRVVLGRVWSRGARPPLTESLPGAGRKRPGTDNFWSWRAERKIRAWWAIPVIALMAAAAAVLTWATASLAQHGIAASHAASAISAGRLVAPAPRTAGRLPLRVGTTQDPADQAIMNRLQHRFSAVTSRLLNAAPHDGTANGPTATVRPSGLYGEPGHLDPVTSRPSWVMYLGMQSSGSLGQPQVTIGTLMMGILGKYSKIGPWPVPPGHRGGQASCTDAWLANTEVSVCGWTSAQTVGIVASPARETSTGELATLLIKMRYDLQRRA